MMENQTSWAREESDLQPHLNKVTVWAQVAWLNLRSLLIHETSHYTYLHLYDLDSTDLRSDQPN